MFLNVRTLEDIVKNCTVIITCLPNPSSVDQMLLKLFSLIKNICG